MKTMVGVDVGGTFVKLGLVRGRRILTQQSFPTAPVAASPSALQSAVADAVERLIQSRRAVVSGVGVGIPGLVEFPEGVVLSCANLKGWGRVPLKANLRRRLGLRVEVDNDVKVMTLAEWTYGAGRGARNLLCVTLGTGVGGGLVLGGRLYRGKGGPSGEIGHLWVEKNGLVCGCGGRGCLERYVGNQAILRSVRMRLRRGEASVLRKMLKGQWSRLTPEMIDQACAKGDRLSLETWTRAGERIGLVLANVVNLLNPEKIVIGGGLAKAGRWIFDPIRQTVRARTIRSLGPVPIVPAALGSSAGIVGAALLAQENQRVESRG